MADPTLTLYTHPSCPHCQTAKAWLSEQKCAFTERDITKDVATLREWRELTGGVGVPVLALGKDFVVGFNPERYAQLMDCAEHSTRVEAA